MKKGFVISLLLLLILSICGAIGAVGVYFYISDDLPDIKDVADYHPYIVTTIYSAEGEIIGELYKERRYIVPLERIPTKVVQAFLAAEDKAFYEHDGVNFVSIIRAFIINTWHGAVKQGGSTITQQVVKALLLTPERTYTRKIKEAILAYSLEKHLTKEEILSLYLNQIYFGEGAYGVEAASRAYFAKHVEDLTVAEATILAGFPKAPSTYNPYRNPEPIKQRQAYVLGQMLEMNWITKQEYDDALTMPLEYKKWDSKTSEQNEATQWYVEQVRQELLQFFAPESLKEKNIRSKITGEEAIFMLGLQIYTPLRIKEQIAAHNALRKGLEETSKRRGFQGVVAQYTTQEEIRNFIQETTRRFVEKDFIQGKYTQAVVTSVTPQSAIVAFGAYTGEISLADMSWARKPNINESLLNYNKVKAVNNVLSIGDVIYIARKGEHALKTEARIPVLLAQVPAMEGAIISINVQNGDVIAMTGGYDFTVSKFNRAIQAKRQPGSAFKPIVYSTAMDNGYTPASLVLDAPVAMLDTTTNKLWRPDNYENNFHGYMLLRKGLALSRNLVTIRIAQDIGVQKIIARAKALGLTGTYPNELGISLGAAETTLLQLTDAFTTFANLGTLYKPRFITSIKDSAGYTLYEFPVEGAEVISPQNAYIMQYLLRAVVEEGTGTRAKALQIPIIGKTGTSNDEKDAWFIGSTPQITTGVFVGFDQAQSLGKYEGGARTALPIFVDYMMKIRSLYSKEDFPQPRDIIYLRVDTKTGLLPGRNSSSTLLMPFIRGTEPTQSTSSSSPDSNSNVLKDLF